MTEYYKPCVAIITSCIMGFGLIGTVPFFTVFGIIIYPGWAVCAGVLFLCEYLFRRKHRGLYTTNIGAFIATAIMGITLIVWLVIEADAHTGGKFDFYEMEQQLYLLMFLPPTIGSLGVNIGNIIYKVRREKSEKPSDRQP